MPGFNPEAHNISFHIATIARNSEVGSGARIAIITVPGGLQEAETMFNIVRTTQVPVPRWIDPRGVRTAATWWMQPR